MRLYLMAAVVVTSLSGIPAMFGAGLVNGGVETGDLTGWTRLSDPSAGAFTYTAPNLTGGLLPHDGSYFFTFSNSAPSVSGISQTVATTLGQAYTLSFWFTTATNADASNEMKVKWNTTTLIDQVNFASMGAVYTGYSFQVSGTGSDTLSFSGYQNHGYNGLDSIALDVSNAATPEPSTFGLGLAAMGIVVAAARRPRWGASTSDPNS